MTWSADEERALLIVAFLVLHKLITTAFYRCRKLTFSGVFCLVGGGGVAVVVVWVFLIKSSIYSFIRKEVLEKLDKKSRSEKLCCDVVEKHCVYRS